jgi:transposase-like protein
MATARSRLRQIPIPTQWDHWTQRGFLDAVALARKALFVVQGWAANSSVQRARLQGGLAEALRSLEVSREEGRILRLRLEERPAQQRPHYPAEARLAILALRAATGWTVEETARRFQVTPMTLHNWMRRLDETKESGLLALPAPVNKYPDFVEVLVKQLGRVAPLIGKKRIADVLARAGLHLAPTTVARLRAHKGPEPKPPSAGATGEAAAAQSAAAEAPSAKWVTSKRPHHVWNLDFTLLPTTPGWWVPWVPWSLLQRWPFCFWLGVVMDHYSRSVVAWEALPEAADRRRDVRAAERSDPRSGHTPEALDHRRRLAVSRRVPRRGVRRLGCGRVAAPWARAGASRSSSASSARSRPRCSHG